MRYACGDYGLNHKGKRISVGYEQDSCFQKGRHTLAIMLRYIPTVREDWRYIKDAMRLRDVSPSFVGLLKNPSMTIECLYVPLLMAASKAADELSIAAVTRGIENPRQRTCLVQIRLHIQDYLAIGCFMGLCIVMFAL